MYGMNNSGKLSADKLTDWLINEEGLKPYQCQISIYYKYSPDGTKVVVLYRTDDFLLVYI